MSYIYSKKMRGTWSLGMTSLPLKLGTLLYLDPVLESTQHPLDHCPSFLTFYRPIPWRPRKKWELPCIQQFLWPWCQLYFFILQPIEDGQEWLSNYFKSFLCNFQQNVKTESISAISQKSFLYGVVEGNIIQLNNIERLNTIVPHYGQEIGSRTPQRAKSVDVQVPYIKLNVLNLYLIVSSDVELIDTKDQLYTNGLWPDHM